MNDSVKSEPALRYSKSKRALRKPGLKAKVSRGRPREGERARVRVTNCLIDPFTAEILNAWSKQAGGYGQLIDQLTQFAFQSGFEPFEKENL